jgi:hypothetical protein
MNSRMKILGWLQLLMLSAGIAARMKLVENNRWFRRPHDAPGYPGRIRSRQKLGHDNPKKIQAMKIQICLLHWLSLLQVSACPGWQPEIQSDHLRYRYKKYQQKSKYNLNS